MKNIHLLTTYRYDEAVIKNRLGVLANVASQNGFKVHWCCSGPDELDDKDSLNAALEGVTFLVSPRIKKEASFSIRAIQELLLSIQLVSYSRTVNQRDLLLLSVPSAMSLFMFPMLAFRHRVILDVRDLSWIYFKANRKLFIRFFGHLLEFFALRAVRRAMVTLVTNAKEAELIEEMSPDSSVQVMSDGISMLQYEKLVSLASVMPKSKTTIVYIGNVGAAQNLTTFLKCAVELQSMDFIIVGEGREFTSLKRRFDFNQNVVFAGKLPWDRLQHYYQRASILYLQISEEYTSAIPSKFYEYISAGRRIVLAASGISVLFSGQFAGVHCVSPGDVIAQRKLLEQLEKMPHLTAAEIEKNRAIIRKDFIRETSCKSALGLVHKMMLKNNAGYDDV